MELRNIAFYLKNQKDHIFLEPIGDIHVGSPLVDYEKLQKRINAIRDEPNRHTIIMGDVIDNIMAYAGGMVDKRWNSDIAQKDLMTTEEQSDKFVELFEPIKHKIIGILSGNHEWKTFNRRRFEKDFCEELEVPYLGYECMIHIGCYYKKSLIRDFEMWACHGSFGGMTVGGGINRLKQLAGQYDADIYLHAHTHDKAFYIDEQLYHDPKKNDLFTRPKIYVMTGTFMRAHMKGIDHYGERRPSPRLPKVGTITVDLVPHEGKIHVHE